MQDNFQKEEYAYKCRSCGGILVHKDGKYRCPHCGANFNEDSLNQSDRVKCDYKCESDNKGGNGNLAPTLCEKDKQLKYFSFYKILPAIIMGIILVLSVVLGIVLICGGSLIWGLMLLIMGVICAIVSYFVLKVIFSHSILHIYYLQKLAGEENKILTDENDIKKSN